MRPARRPLRRRGNKARGISRRGLTGCREKVAAGGSLILPTVTKVMQRELHALRTGRESALGWAPSLHVVLLTDMCKALPRRGYWPMTRYLTLISCPTAKMRQPRPPALAQACRASSVALGYIRH